MAYAPLDPECPEVAAFVAALNEDPITEATGALTDEIMEAFKLNHLATCKQCRDFGGANTDIAENLIAFSISPSGKPRRP